MSCCIPDYITTAALSTMGTKIRFTIGPSKTYPFNIEHTAPESVKRVKSIEHILVKNKGGSQKIKMEIYDGICHEANCTNLVVWMKTFKICNV